MSDKKYKTPSTPHLLSPSDFQETETHTKTPCCIPPRECRSVKFSPCDSTHVCKIKEPRTRNKHTHTENRAGHGAWLMGGGASNGSAVTIQLGLPPLPGINKTNNLNQSRNNQFPETLTIIHKVKAPFSSSVSSIYSTVFFAKTASTTYISTNRWM